jgi:catechol 2,3-dioxygenase-like lactoylglutathione lyase family enzyme
MNRFVLCSIALLVTLPALAAQDRFPRPPITGIHHVRFYSANLDKSRAFYVRVLGLLPADSRCTSVGYSCFAVAWGQHLQHIELQQVPSPAPKDWLAELAFSTDDVLKLRLFLMTHGVEPGRVLKNAYGDQHFEVRDPEGNRISFIARSAVIPVVDPPPSHAVSTRILHAGFVVKDRAAMDHFYKDILGFHLYWHGGFKDNDTDWYELQVPDGDEWIEYMLNIPASADHKELGVQNHFSLGVRDIHAAQTKIKVNGAASYDGPEVGRDGKWSLDLYDPDATRVELMEFTPVEKPCCSDYSGPHPKP